MSGQLSEHFQTTFFPSRILQKQKHRRPINLRCFFNRVASQTPGTDASEWAAGFRPWPGVPNYHAGRPAVREWHYNCFTGKLKRGCIKGRLKSLFTFKLSTISAFLKIIPIETFFAFSVEKHRKLNYIIAFPTSCLIVLKIILISLKMHFQTTFS